MNKPDKSRWLVERERLRIADRHPPRLEPDLSLRASLAKIFTKLDSAAGREIESIRKSWPDIAGESAARHSRPGMLREGFLEINVDSSAWLQEIKRWHGVEMLAKIQSRAGKGTVKALRFQVNPEQRRNN